MYNLMPAKPRLDATGRVTIMRGSLTDFKVPSKEKWSMTIFL
jgi:hypothetical protein